MKRKVIIIAAGLMLILSAFSCNLTYEENNDPNAFRAIALTPAFDGGNMHPLSFGTSSGNASNRVGTNLNNGIIVNPDGSIILRAHNSNANAGKIAGSEDGITFYFKEVEADKNFKLRADVEVIFFALQNGRTELNGQEAWGIMARDCVPQYPGTTMEEVKEKLKGKGLSNYDWSNYSPPSGGTYHAGSTGGTSNMIMVGGVKRGVRVYWRTGVTDPTTAVATEISPEGIGDYVYDGSYLNDASKAQFFYQPRDNLDYSQYATINDRPDFAPAGSKYTLYLEKNNSGFLVRITPPDGRGGDTNYRRNPYDLTVDTTEIGVGRVLEYFIPEPDMLTSINQKYYYVGFFASRSAEVKVSNFTYEEADMDECAPRIEMLPEQFTPSFSVVSPGTTATGDYTFYGRANVEGNIAISLNDQLLPEAAGLGKWTVETSNASGRPFNHFEIPVTGLKEGNNVFQITFYPDRNQTNSGLLLSSTNVVTTTFIVHRKSYGENIYVSPNGRSTYTGTYDNPLDLETAIAYVQPGQKIIMKDGIYSPLSVVIPRYNSGKPNTDTGAPNAPLTSNPNYEDDPYYKYYKVLQAENRDRAIIDFLGHPYNKGFEMRGDYWVLSGFHVRGTAPAKKKGITLMGNYNRIEWVKTYFNGDTGIQISGESSEPKVMWPAYNVVAYCESFYNKDEARNDADGFAAKLTVGEGNLFEWCIAHNNVDDGWDLFTKKETGDIGIVIIDHCIAYKNGYWLSEHDRDANNWDVIFGNDGGNGFKVGGEGLAIKHIVRQSLAFINGGDGFTSNSNPALQLDHCTAFDNEDRGFAVYGSGSSSIVDPVQNYGSRTSWLLSMYSAGATNRSDTVLVLPSPLLNSEGDPTGSNYTNPVNPGIVWYNGRYNNTNILNTIDRSGNTYTTDNNIVSTVLPIREEIGPAPFENELTGPIRGRWVQRDANGKFILNDFMKTQRINGTQPGATELY